MFRLGFPVRIVGRPGLRSHDARRSLDSHLSVSLVYLRDVLTYLQRIGVRFYRIAAALLPAAPPTARSPSYCEALQQINECTTIFHHIAEQVRTQGVRLTIHMEYHVALGCADEALARRSLEEIEVCALLLERLGAQSDGVLVVHVGGAASDTATLKRFAARYKTLSAQAQARLVVEHDTSGFSLGSLLRLHQSCGVPIVFDYLHWSLHNPENLPLDLALGLALATWPATMRPKVHVSTARSEAHLLPARAGYEPQILPPRPGQHADFLAATDMISLLRAARGLAPFDVMIEAKAGDLALLRVRSDVTHLAPELAPLIA